MNDDTTRLLERALDDLRHAAEGVWMLRDDQLHRLGVVGPTKCHEALGYYWRADALERLAALADR